MTDENKNIEKRVDKLETKFEVLVQELHDFKDEMRDFKTEMRQQNEMRANEIREIRQRQDAMQAKHDAEMHEMNKKIDENAKEFTKQLHTNFVQTMIGVGAIMAAIGGLIIAAIK